MTLLSLKMLLLLKVGFELARDDSFSIKSDLEKLHIKTDRCSKDTFINNNGYSLIELCKSLDIKIVNGRFGSDEGSGGATGGGGHPMILKRKKEKRGKEEKGG